MQCNESRGDEIDYRELLEPLKLFFRLLDGWFNYVLCICGVAANGLIVAVLLRRSMRYNPFNHFLILIALFDAFVMATFLLFKQVPLCHPWYFTYGWTLYTKYYAISSLYAHSASLWLTVNMAVLRFVVLHHGTSASRLNRSRGAVMLIMLALIIAFIGSFPNMMRYEIDDVGSIHSVVNLCSSTKWNGYWRQHDNVTFHYMGLPSWWTCQHERASFWTTSVVLKLVPCILLTIFMTLLVSLLVEARKRRERLGSAPPSERTTAMLTVIVAVVLATELPQGIMLSAVGVWPQLYALNRELNELFDLLSLINAAVNFLLCALMSAIFRRECLHLLTVCPRKTRLHNNHMHTLPNGFTPLPTECQ